MRCSIILCFFTNTQFYLITYHNVLCDNCLIDLASFTDLCLVHDNGIADHGSLTDRYAASDDGIIYLSIDIGTFADDTSLYHTVPSDVIGGLDLTLGIDLPVLLIQVELGHNINQFHIGFPIGA